MEDLTGPAEGIVDRLAWLDPLSPVAYRVLALRALGSASGDEPDERTALAWVGALERERAVSHLGWLSIFGCLLGYMREQGFTEGATVRGLYRKSA